MLFTHQRPPGRNHQDPVGGPGGGVFGKKCEGEKRKGAHGSLPRRLFELIRVAERPIDGPEGKEQSSISGKTEELCKKKGELGTCT